MGQWESTGTLYCNRTSLFQTFIAVTELLWRRLMVTHIFLSYDPHLQIEIFHTCFQLKLKISSPSNLSYLYNTPHLTCDMWNTNANTNTTIIQYLVLGNWKWKRKNVRTIKLLLYMSGKDHSITCTSILNIQTHQCPDELVNWSLSTETDWSA